MLAGDYAALAGALGLPEAGAREQATGGAGGAALAGDARPLALDPGQRPGRRRGARRTCRAAARGTPSSPRATRLGAAWPSRWRCATWPREEAVAFLLGAHGPTDERGGGEAGRGTGRPAPGPGAGGGLHRAGAAATLAYYLDLYRAALRRAPGQGRPARRPLPRHGGHHLGDRPSSGRARPAPPRRSCSTCAPSWGRRRSRATLLCAHADDAPRAARGGPGRPAAPAARRRARCVATPCWTHERAGAHRCTAWWPPWPATGWTRRGARTWAAAAAALLAAAFPSGDDDPPTCAPGRSARGCCRTPWPRRARGGAGRGARGTRARC